MTLKILSAKARELPNERARSPRERRIPWALQQHDAV